MIFVYVCQTAPNLPSSKKLRWKWRPSYLHGFWNIILLKKKYLKKHIKKNVVQFCKILSNDIKIGSHASWLFLKVKCCRYQCIFSGNHSDNTYWTKVVRLIKFYLHVSHLKNRPKDINARMTIRVFVDINDFFIIMLETYVAEVDQFSYLHLTITQKVPRVIWLTWIVEFLLILIKFNK